MTKTSLILLALLALVSGTAAHAQTTTATSAPAATAPNQAASANLVYAHDPSTPTLCDGRWYVYSTGTGCPARSSTDLINWRREPSVFTTLPAWVFTVSPQKKDQGVWAPDVKFLNGKYYLYYAVAVWGNNNCGIGLATSPTLDPTNPKYHWTDQGVVVTSKEGENVGAIDPSVLLDPQKHLWLSYGSFKSGVKLIQLDLISGKPLPGAQVIPIVDTGEASYLYHRKGWYYIFFNIGSCCQGAKSTYNIRMGRSRTVTGPYLDKDGVDLMHHGGSLFLGSGNGVIGPGQIGIFSYKGKDMFSFHAEWSETANNGKGAGSQLEIRPLFWANGWPEADNGKKSKTNR